MPVSPPPTITDRLQRARSLYQKGIIAEAEKACGEILASDPDNLEILVLRARALARLGKFAEALVHCDRVIALAPRHLPALAFRAAVALPALGRHNEALETFDRALQLSPDNVELLSDRGNALRELGRFSEAILSYDRAIALAPNEARIHSNRANALLDAGRAEEALTGYDLAITLKPDYANAHSNRANLLRSMGRLEESLAASDRAIALDPRLANAHANRGAALVELRRPGDALAACEAALAIDPAHAAALSNRGNALKDLERVTEALADYDAAIAAKPDFAAAWVNRGILFTALARYDEALADLDRAVAIKSDNAEAQCNRGVVLHRLGRFEEALACNAIALSLRPNWAEALLNDALTWLLLGRFDKGLPAYESRKRVRDRPGVRSFPAPEWRGSESLAGRTILVHAEQGLGDTLHFCRYLRLLHAKGAKVVFAVQNELKMLARSLDPALHVVRFSEIPRSFDFHAYLLDLPLALGTTLDSIPADVPYLSAEPGRVKYWKGRLGDVGFKVGINWCGRQGKADLGRSFPLAALAGLARVPGVRLVSLQKGAGTEQLASLPSDMRVETLGEDFDAGPDAFADSAAAMASLDLVITSDTAIAHLAGALARPAWVSLKHIPDWRWLLGRMDTPWYPTLRLFRQAAPGDWTSVFSSMEQELKRVARSRDDESEAVMPAIPVSWGELIDKITILEIKRHKVVDPAARANIEKELFLLLEKADRPAPARLLELQDALKAVNNALWDAEDDLRGKEANGTFDDEFIALARSIYRHNDRRAALKREINELLNSVLVEEKLYKSYQGQDEDSSQRQ
jgi:tetratricopeptide (TPR) repeat protein